MGKASCYPHTAEVSLHTGPLSFSLSSSPAPFLWSLVDLFCLFCFGPVPSCYLFYDGKSLPVWVSFSPLSPLESLIHFQGCVFMSQAISCLRSSCSGPSSTHSMFCWRAQLNFPFLTTDFMRALLRESNHVY